MFIRPSVRLLAQLKTKHLFTSSNNFLSYSWLAAIQNSRILRRYYTINAKFDSEPGALGISQVILDQKESANPLIKATIPILQVIVDNSKIELDLMWLRDHCTCPMCWDHTTLQRNFHHFEIKENINVKELKYNESSIAIKWDNDHESIYSYEWLRNHHESFASTLNYYTSEKVLWDRNIIGPQLENLPRVEYNDVINGPNGMKDLINIIQKYGIGLVEGTPVNSQDTKTLCEKIGPIRHTHYGGFWEFEANALHNDAAYQDHALEPHTDTTYFTDPAGLQIFHLLEFDGSGGEQTYMDGYKMALNFKKSYPELYQVLATVKQPYHSAGDEDIYHSTNRFTVFQHETPGDINSPLINLRYNYDSRSSLQHIKDPIEMRLYYTALNTFISTQHQDPNNRVVFPLKKGTTIILDNYRVLHGRNKFSATKRKLCGAYINHDDLLSKWRIVNSWDKKLGQGSF